MAKEDENYVVYNPHLDEFVRIVKYSDEELGDILLSFKKLINSPGVKISEYVKKVIFTCVRGAKSYKYDEVCESLFECVVDVYPLFQIDVACKAVNEIGDITFSEDKTQILTLDKINKLRTRLNKCVVGQPQAVEECIKVIKLVSSGLDKFISLFFIGPTGVGKTELARLLAKEYLGNPKRLLKINCGEYSTGHEYAKLIGSPPGYVGHNEKGILTERAAESSEWIIIFDEVEKAHTKMMDLLLGFLDDGMIMDSHGTDLDFTDSIIVFTSNVGLKDTVGKKLLGFGADTQTYEQSKGVIDDQFKTTFTPEFRNRLDSIVYFNGLTKQDAVKIARLQLKELPIRITPKLVSFVVEGGFSEEYGARNLRRFIRNHVTVQIAERILETGKTSKYKSIFSKEGALRIEEQ